MKGTSVSLFFLSLLIQSSWEAGDKEEPLASAIFIFGDSLLDPGNSNYLDVKPLQANYPPYGCDFDGGPTGRYTNGKTFADFIAEKLGLPPPPPYQHYQNETRDIPLTGVNYASGACGIIGRTGEQIGSCMSFEAQLNHFENSTLLDIEPQFVDAKEFKKYLANSVFLIAIGANDYINNYLQPYYGTASLYIPRRFAAMLIEEMNKFIKLLHRLGARKFLIFDINAIGCMQFALSSTAECNIILNGIVYEYNKLLPPLLRQLESELEEATFIHGKLFEISMAMHYEPSKFNITTTSKPCCEVSGSGLCVIGGEKCSNKDEYLFWDSFHPTEIVHKSIAKYSFQSTVMLSTSTRISPTNGIISGLCICFLLLLHLNRYLLLPSSL